MILPIALITLLAAASLWWHAFVPLNEIDSYAYHLPISQQLVETKSLFDIFHAGFVGPNTYFPANHEALRALSEIVFRTDFFAPLVTVFGVGLFLFCASSLALFARIRPWMVLLPIITMITIPFLLKQLTNFQVDLFLFGLIGSSLTLFFLGYERREWKYIIGACIVFGLALGTKYNALAQAVVIVPIFILGIAHHFERRIIRIFQALGLMSLTGGVWYARNWILTGNPIYPFGAGLFEGHRTFLVPMRGTSLLEVEHASLIIEKLTSHHFAEQLGWPIFFIGSAIVLACIMILRRNIRWGIAAIFLIAGQFFIYARSPYTATLFDETIRYSAGFFATAACIIMLGVFLAPRKGRIALIGLLAVALIGNLANTGFAFKGIHALPDRDAYLLSAEFPKYRELLPHLRVLRRQVLGRIALAGATPYALFTGAGYPATYINIDGCTACKYHDYRSLQRSIRAHPDEQRWLKFLQEREIAYLLVDEKRKDAGQSALFESLWAKRHPEIFVTLRSDEFYTLYGNSLHHNSVLQRSKNPARASPAS